MATKHLKAYCKFNKVDKEDIVCEITGRPARLGHVDISHNIARGMGGRPNDDMDTQENLMALHRNLHDFLEANPKYYWWFQLVHIHYLHYKIPYYDLDISSKDPIFEEIKQQLT